MKVWELMAILSKAPAGADVYGNQLPNDSRTELRHVNIEDDNGPDDTFVNIEFCEAEE